jgi:hypothetical protein
MCVGLLRHRHVTDLTEPEEGLGIVEAKPDEEAKVAKPPGMTSRFNMMFSNRILIAS